MDDSRILFAKLGKSSPKPIFRVISTSPPLYRPAANCPATSPAAIEFTISCSQNTEIDSVLKPLEKLPVFDTLTVPSVPDEELTPVEFLEQLHKFLPRYYSIPAKNEGIPETEQNLRELSKLQELLVGVRGELNEKLNELRENQARVAGLANEAVEAQQSLKRTTKKLLDKLMNAEIPLNSKEEELKQNVDSLLEKTKELRGTVKEEFINAAKEKKREQEIFGAISQAGAAKNLANIGSQIQRW